MKSKVDIFKQYDDMLDEKESKSKANNISREQLAVGAVVGIATIAPIFLEVLTDIRDAIVSNTQFKRRC